MLSQKVQRMTKLHELYFREPPTHTLTIWRQRKSATDSGQQNDYVLLASSRHANRNQVGTNKSSGYFFYLARRVASIVVRTSSAERTTCHKELAPPFPIHLSFSISCQTPPAFVCQRCRRFLELAPPQFGEGQRAVLSPRRIGGGG